MTPKPLLSNSCHEESGFLFQHPCGLPAQARCTRCGKPICGAHLVSQGGEFLCKTCGAADSDEDEDADEDTSEDDPSYYYEGYGSTGGQGHDPNDFTEADGESLRHEDDASFEEDLGGS